MDGTDEHVAAREDGGAHGSTYRISVNRYAVPAPIDPALWTRHPYTLKGRHPLTVLLHHLESANACLDRPSYGNYSNSRMFTVHTGVLNLAAGAAKATQSNQSSQGN